MFGLLEVMNAHVQFESLRWTVIVPKFNASFNVLERLLPLTLDVTFKGLSKDRVELLDMLLKTNYIAVKCEHVIDSLFSKAMDVDILVLLQFDQISYLVFIVDLLFLSIVEWQIKGVQTNRLFWFLELFHCDDVDFTQSVTSFERH